MAYERTIAVRNATIASCSEFSTGHMTDYLQFYDERYRPSFPLTSLTVSQYFREIWNTPYSDLWKAGCITGWIDAMMENDDGTFMSLPVAEFARLGAQ